ncbi:MAG: autotransporter-associated beta strand repeat-containing protein, partial [Verrucomicrobiaceae bacterium]|nr:autotransporter-associated beta strand repeat-containing protein [Verrucomicrobiaceae bacterium]
ALNINNAFNLITLTNAGSNVQISTTGTGTIARGGNGTALIRGTSLGTVAAANTTNVILGTAPTATGQAGANATTNRAILPYIIVDPSASGDGTGASAGFAVYDTTANVGLRALAPSEATSAFTLDQNILVNSGISAGGAAPNLTTSRVNSLTFETGGSLAIEAMRNVTVQSGGILAKASASITTSITGTGYLNADANANLIFHTMGAGTTLTVNVPVGGVVGPSTGGLAKSGEGTLVLNAQNSYLGETRVNAGILQIGAAAPATNALMYRWSTAPAINATASAVVADLLVIQPGAILDLNGHNQSTGRLATSLALPGAGGILTSATAASYHNLVGANSDFSGQITGSITYARSGGFIQTFTNDNTFTGSTSLYGGVTSLIDQGRFSGTSDLTINRSSLRWDDSGIQGMSNRLASTIDITFNGGGFEYRSRSGTDGSITLDQLTFQSGASYLVANVGNGGVGSATINYGGLIRAAGTGATATLAASNGAAGDNPFFKAASAPTLTAGILSPWLTVFSSINPSSGTVGGAFATYDPVVGIRPISAYYETNSFATSTTTSNLRFGDVNPVVPDGGATVNTLTWNGLTAARTLNFQNAADTLTLTAGGLITGNENFAKNIGTALLRGRLTTGASELFLYNTANTLTVNSELFGTYDLILGSMSQTANTPTISLTNANTYTGNTFVNGMVLTLNNATGSGNAIPGNITVAGGTQAGGDSAPIANAAVRLLTSNQIADSATVTVRGGSQIDLNGFSDIVDALVLVNDGGSNANQGALVQTGAGTLTVISGNITAAVQNSISTIPTIAGNLVLGSTATVNVGLVSGTEVTVNGTTNSQVGLAINANVKGATTLNKTGPGVLQLGGVSDSLTAINVTTGTVVLGAASNYKNATLNLSAGTILDTRGANNLAIGTISGSGIIKNFSLTANSTLVTGNSTSGIFSGTMGSDYTTAAQAPWLSVTKIGTGTWTLTGDNENNLLGTL